MGEFAEEIRSLRNEGEVWVGYIGGLLSKNQVLDNSPVGIWENTPSGGCTYANPAWFAITGLNPSNPDDWCGDAWEKAIHPEDRGQVRAEWQASVDEAAPFDMQFRFVNQKSGMVHLVRCRANPIMNGGNIPKGYSGTTEILA